MSFRDIDFNKYCNCYNNRNKIDVQCYDYMFEAVQKVNEYHGDSRLVVMKKYYPTFIQKMLVQYAFIKPVEFTSKISNEDNKNKTENN